MLYRPKSISNLFTPKQDALNLFYWDNVDALIIAIMTFSSIVFGVAYYFILKSLFNLKAKNIRPLFAVPLVLMILTVLYDPGYVPLAIWIDCSILLILIIVAPIYGIIKNKVPLSTIAWLLTVGAIVPISIMTAPYGLIPLIVLILVLSTLTPSKSDTFYDLQTLLPSSKIRSMAMGLVEVYGKTVMLEPLISKIKKVPCIGYIYKIDIIRTDNKGRTYYDNILTETQCNTFQITDDTGTVTIKGENISLLDFPKSEHSYESNGRRYQQFLLKEDMDVLLIGKATNKDGQVFVEKDPTKNIFAIAPLDYVYQHNQSTPLYHSFIRHFIFLIVIISIVLLCNINIEGEKIVVSFFSLF
ncbi:hypothetical protein SAMN04488513_1217 [Pseudozobellia thermophila]|uniref:Uncharacterized protein n=1 Tax=Pseudozobellia thermophila TaxID=192903 RepID=A0A1M6PFY2_9FLAO|nr:hypothetical protein SAMN04488513_1217 [Pseudozobellia thermophila]